MSGEIIAYVIPYRTDRNGLGTAALVLAVAALLLALIPVIGMLAWALWPLGVALAGAALDRANRGAASNRNMSVIALMMSTTAGMVCLAWAVVTMAASVS